MSINYYKVCSTKKGFLESSNREYDSSKNPFILEYNLNKETIAPNNSGLFVFDDLKHAMNFIIDIDGAILECDVKNPREIDFKTNSVKSHRIEHFWYLYYLDMPKRTKKILLEAFCSQTLKGTKICDSIIPRKIIYRK